MSDMAEWINDDTPWDGIGPDPEERAIIERDEYKEKYVSAMEERNRYRYELQRLKREWDVHMNRYARSLGIKDPAGVPSHRSADKIKAKVAEIIAERDAAMAKVEHQGGTVAWVSPVCHEAGRSFALCDAILQLQEIVQGLLNREGE